MGTLLVGEGGAVLVAAALADAPPSLVALEGLGEPALRAGRPPAYPLAALADDTLPTEGIDDVRLVAGEPATRAGARSWARAHGLPCRDLRPQPLPRPAGVRVAAVSAPQTGSGKSAVTLRLARLLRRAGAASAVARHPLPNLLHWEGREGAVLVRAPDELRPPRALEEFEEVAPLVAAGVPVAVGLDPQGVLRAAAKAVGPGGVVVWDGGGSAEPWVGTDLHVVVIDLLRPLPEVAEERVRAADVLVLTKAGEAPADTAKETESRVREWNPDAPLVVADMLPSITEGQRVMDRRVVIVEDWPSLVLGGLRAGAGAVLARRFRCGVVDPRPFAVGAIARALEEHPHIGPVVPSLGRTPAELADLEATLLHTPGDLVLWASPAPPTRSLATADRLLVAVQTELLEIAGSTLQAAAEPLLAGTGGG